MTKTGPIELQADAVQGYRLPPRRKHLWMLQQGNSKTDYRQDICVHQFVEEQAACTPNQLAVVCEDRILTYSELNARALASTYQNLLAQEERERCDRSRHATDRERYLTAQLIFGRLIIMVAKLLLSARSQKEVT